MKYFSPKIKKILLPKNVFWAMLNIALLMPFWAANAGAPGEGSPLKLDNPLGEIKSVSELVSEVAKVVSQIGISVAAVFIIYAGFLYVSARGSEEKIGKAHQTLTWTLIGTAVLLGAWAIAEAVAKTIKTLGS
jgi:hypothetical protein